MKDFNKHEALIKYLKDNNGVTILRIINFLDYMDKALYSEVEVLEMIEDIKKEYTVVHKGDLWLIE